MIFKGINVDQKDALLGIKLKGSNSRIFSMGHHSMVMKVLSDVYNNIPQTCKYLLYTTATNTTTTMTYVIDEKDDDDDDDDDTNNHGGDHQSISNKNFTLLQGLSNI